jgi:hypothetical protein
MMIVCEAEAARMKSDSFNDTDGMLARPVRGVKFLHGARQRDNLADAGCPFPLVGLKNLDRLISDMVRLRGGGLPAGSRRRRI